MDAFVIKTHVYEGPLDLLLSLIEKRKLFINDLSLSQVTDDYITHVNQLSEYSILDRTAFISIASTLLLIKAKSLLPSMPLTEDEVTDIKHLELRLKKLEAIRAASEVVKKSFGRTLLFERGELKQEIKVFVPSKDSTVSEINSAIMRVLNFLPKKAEEPPKLAVKTVVSIEEMISRLTNRIQSAVKMTFREFSGLGKTGKAGDRAEKVDVIVSFLALLELVKQGVLDAKQEGLFDEIEMEGQEVGVPRYQ